MVSDKFGIPVAITNDANAAAIGEMTYGAARGLKDFIMITLGTGVGSGIVINGQLVYGHDGFAGELGHTIMKRNNGRLCGCGRTGCLEAYCSASGVARTAREFLEIRTEPSALRTIPIEAITSKDVYDAAVAGDKLANEIFEYTGNILGEAFAEFTVFSSPQAIILFGGPQNPASSCCVRCASQWRKTCIRHSKARCRFFFQSSKTPTPPCLAQAPSAGKPRPRFRQCPGMTHACHLT